MTSYLLSFGTFLLSNVQKLRAYDAQIELPNGAQPLRNYLLWRRSASGARRASRFSPRHFAGGYAGVALWNCLRSRRINPLGMLG